MALQVWSMARNGPWLGLERYRPGHRGGVARKGMEDCAADCAPLRAVLRTAPRMRSGLRNLSFGKSSAHAHIQALRCAT